MTGVFERHLRASASTDLTPRDERCDIDRLTAAGFVAQHHALGMALYAMKFQADTGKTEECMRGLYPIVRRWKDANRLPGKASDITREVLVWWVDDLCRACEGRKLILIPDTARLASKRCMACRGSGKKLLGNENYEAKQFTAMQIEILVDAVHEALRRKKA